MKKALLFLTAIVAITACQSAQNSKANLNSNAPGNQPEHLAAMIAGGTTLCDPPDANEIRVPVRIVHKDKIETVRDIYINRRNQEMAGWCIENHTDDPVRVLIGSLRLIDATKDNKPPFNQGDWWDNTVLSDVIEKGGHEHRTTQVANKSGTYEYFVFLFGADGKLLNVQDPQVVISDGKTDDAKQGSKTDARPGNANSPNKNSK